MRCINELRLALTLVEAWLNAAFNDPKGFTKKGVEFLKVRRYDLLKEILRTQLKEFSK